MFQRLNSLPLFAVGIFAGIATFVGGASAEDPMQIKLPHHVHGLAFSGDGKMLAGIGADVPLDITLHYSQEGEGKGLATVWDLTTLKAVKTLSFKYPLFAGFSRPTRPCWPRSAADRSLKPLMSRTQSAPSGN